MDLHIPIHPPQSGMIFVKVQCSCTVGDDLRKSGVVFYSWCRDTCPRGVSCEAGFTVAGLSSSFVEAGFTRKIACHKQKEAFHSNCPKSFLRSQQPAISSVVINHNSQLMTSNYILRPNWLKTLTPLEGGGRGSTCLESLKLIREYPLPLPCRL